MHFCVRRAVKHFPHRQLNKTVDAYGKNAECDFLIYPDGTYPHRTEKMTPLTNTKPCF